MLFKNEREEVNIHLHEKHHHSLIYIKSIQNIFIWRLYLHTVSHQQSHSMTHLNSTAPTSAYVKTIASHRRMIIITYSEYEHSLLYFIQEP